MTEKKNYLDIESLKFDQKLGRKLNIKEQHLKNLWYMFFYVVFWLIVITEQIINVNEESASQDLGDVEAIQVLKVFLHDFLQQKDVLKVQGSLLNENI